MKWHNVQCNFTFDKITNKTNYENNILTAIKKIKETRKKWIERKWNRNINNVNEKENKNFVEMFHYLIFIEVKTISR